MITFSEMSGDVKYWFIRAGNNGGKYFHHYKDNKIVALGHADKSGIAFEDGHEFTEAEIAGILVSTRNYMSNLAETKSQITNKTNQLQKFLTGVSINDIVITINEDYMTAGIVKSKPYYSSVGLTLSTARDSGSKEDCNFLLRCGVEWGVTKKRGLMPVELEKAFRYTGSIMQFTQEEQIKALNHWLFPVHFCDDEVRCTLRISAKNDLSNHQLTKLSSFLDEMELMSHYISDNINNDITLAGMLDHLANIKESHQYELKAQHLFMSPGHQFIQLPSSKKLVRYTYPIILSILLSNATYASSDLPPELSGINMVQLHSVLQEYKDEKNIVRLQDSLSVDLSKPSLDMEQPDEDAGWGTADSKNAAL